MWGDNGRQGETRPLQGGCDPRRRHHPDTPSRTGIDVEIMGNNGTQPETRETGKQEGDNGRQVETRPRGGGQTIQHRRACEETMGDKGKQDVGKAGTPSNKGTRREMGDKGKQDLGRRTHHPTQADKGRQDREGRTHHPRQRHHPTQVHMWGHKGRQDIGKADTPSNTGRQGETRPRRADTSSKAEAPSNTGTHVGTQGETRHREGGHTIQHRHAAHISKTRLRESEPANTGTHVGRQWETMGNNRTQ